MNNTIRKQILPITRRDNTHYTLHILGRKNGDTVDLRIYRQEDYSLKLLRAKLIRNHPHTSVRYTLLGAIVGLQ